jgi:hypothetical protein
VFDWACEDFFSILGASKTREALPQGELHVSRVMAANHSAAGLRLGHVSGRWTDDDPCACGLADDTGGYRRGEQRRYGVSSFGHISQAIDFKGKAITVTSGATSYTDASMTEVAAPGAVAAVTLHSGEPVSAVLNGFTITHDRAAPIRM